MDQPTLVYLETTFVSYLTGRDSNNLLILTKQRSCKRWWQFHRKRFRMVISEPVIRECGRGDVTAVKDRLALLRDIEVLETTNAAAELAVELLKQKAVPHNAAEDALHIAVAAVHRVDYLLSLNFRHINNAVRQRKLEEVCRSCGAVLPEICTPDELMGEDDGTGYSG